MDVTPLVPQGRQVIERYGNGGFRVTGETYRGSILVLPDRSAAWPPTSIDELDLASLEPVLSAVPPVEVLLIGCGRAMAMIDPALRAAARARGEIGRAHVCTPVPNAHPVCRLMLEKTHPNNHPDKLTPRPHNHLDTYNTCETHHH